MPLSKEVKAALEAWKKGEGEFPAALDSGMFFDDEKVFLDAAGKRFDGKVRQAAKEAQEKATATLLEQLGVSDPAQIAEIKERLAASDATATEAQKLSLEVKRLGRELEKEKGNAQGLLGFKIEVLKDRALSPLLGKIHPDFRDLVRENLSAKLTVDGDKIMGPEGKDPEALVEALLKQKPALKAPEIKEGSGTNGQPAKGKPNGAGAPNGEDKRSPLEKVVADMNAAHQQRLAATGQAQ